MSYRLFVAMTFERSDQDSFSCFLSSLNYQTTVSVRASDTKVFVCTPSITLMSVER